MNDIQARSIWVLTFILFVFSLIVQVPTILRADTWRESKGDLRFYIDWTGFMSLQGDRKTYVELYLTLSRDQLTFSESDRGYSGAYEIDIVLDREGRKPGKKNWLGATQIDSLGQASQKVSLFDVGYFLLDPGRYTLSAKVTDLNSERQGSIVQRISIPKFKEEDLCLSQIEFASRIEAASSENKFVKNGIFILPNPLHLYGLQLPVLYFYAEVYNLRFSEGDSSTYTLQYALIDSTDTEVKSSDPRTFRKGGTSSVVAEQTSIVTLGTGRYTLELRATDDLTGEVATQEGEFRVHMPQRPVDLSDSVFLEEQAQQERDIISYIATRSELNLYDEFNLEGKRAFLETFWADRDPTPDTETNEFKEEHLRRFTFANINFRSTTQKQGWKSDMGRIYILYGAPDDIERHTADTESNAWEQWIYESLKGQGGVFFIFGDLEGFSRYTLLHSNLRGEKYDENWEQWINRYRGRY